MALDVCKKHKEIPLQTCLLLETSVKAQFQNIEHREERCQGQCRTPPPLSHRVETHDPSSQAATIQVPLLDELRFKSVWELQAPEGTCHGRSGGTRSKSG